MTEERVLTRRELNRALLERQLLLERQELTAVQAVGRLGGLQAQSTPSPYLSLWTRLEGFERDELTEALTRRRLVKALLQRGTLHIVTPRDFWAIATAGASSAGSSGRRRTRRACPARTLGKLARLVAAELEGGERTFKEMRALLEPYAKGNATPTFLWRRVQGRGGVVHVPPSGIWGYGGQGVYAAADGRVRGEPPQPEEAFDRLVRSYLAAYGPATKQDVGQWAGVPRLTPIAASLARLRTKNLPRRERQPPLRPAEGPTSGSRDARAAAPRAPLRQPHPLARRPLPDPRRPRAVPGRDEERDRARDDPRRRLRRRHVAARERPRRARAVRQARRVRKGGPDGEGAGGGGGWGGWGGRRARPHCAPPSGDRTTGQPGFAYS